jgi:hypothetical protein
VTAHSGELRLPLGRWRRCALLATAGIVGACGSTQPTGNDPAVAQVRAAYIKQSQFQVRLQSTLTAIQQGGGATNNPAMVTGVRAAVLRSLILDTVIAQEAQYAGVAATDADVEAQVTAAASAAGGMNKLQTQLAEAGGSIAQLQDQVRSQLNEQRLEDYFAARRAQQVEQQLGAGTPFADVARAVSDDVNSSAAGGDLGVLSAAALAKDAAPFANAVRSLSVGSYTTSPVHDDGGYDIIEVYSHTAAGWGVRHILVAAPTPYTVRDRPAWFTEALFSTVQQLCSQHPIHVFITDAGADPCVVPSPSPSPSKHAPSAPPTPSPTAAR